MRCGLKNWRLLGVLLSAVWAFGGYAADGYADMREVSRGQAQLYETLDEKLNPDGFGVIPGLLSLGLLLEVEAEYVKQGDNQSSDLRLATFELGLDATPHELLRGHVLLLWEQDATEPIDLDEAYITLGDGENMPLGLTAGRLYLPFGAYYSHFISDPLTLELGQTRKTAAMLGYDHEFFNAQAGAFRRDLAGEDDQRLNRFFGALTLQPCACIQLGGYVMSDIGESDALSEVIKGVDAESSAEALHKAVPGAGGYLHMVYGIFELEFEYLAATKDFEPGVLAEAALRPTTWNVELACKLLENLKLAGRYEQVRDFPNHPETQYGAAASYGLMEHVTLALEYMYGLYDDDQDDRHLFTTQLAFGF